MLVIAGHPVDDCVFTRSPLHPAADDHADTAAAAFNGIFGHKPTGGLVSNAGQHPSTYQRFLSTGPMCR